MDDAALDRDVRWTAVQEVRLAHPKTFKRFLQEFHNDERLTADLARVRGTDPTMNSLRDVAVGWLSRSAHGQHSLIPGFCDNLWNNVKCKHLSIRISLQGSAHAR